MYGYIFSIFARFYVPKLTAYHLPKLPLEHHPELPVYHPKLPPTLNVPKSYQSHLFGVTRVTQAALPIMRKQKSGIIVNISSGVVPMGGFPGFSAYVSTKFALEGLSESMAYELEPFGIKVILVEPGVIRTNIVNGMVIAKKSQDPNSPYSHIIQKVYSNFEHMLETGSSADVVAKVVLNAATSENASPKYLAGKDMQTMMEAKRNMSDEEFHKMMKENLMK